MINSIDSKIMARLMIQARTSWAELGALLGLSAPAAADRVRRLEEKGVIRGYHADIDPAAAGCELGAFIAVSLAHPDGRADFLAFIQRLPEIQECHHVAGEDDYLLKVRCQNTRALERLISDELKTSAGVLRTRTTIILSTAKETCILPLPDEE